MSTLIAFDELDARFKNFENSALRPLYDTDPIVRGIVHTLILIEWEGTPKILSDALLIEPDERKTFEDTMRRLGYACTNKTIHRPSEIDKSELPCFIHIDDLDGVLLDVDGDTAVIYDYHNDVTITRDMPRTTADLCTISYYSKLFREPPPQSQDRSNWVKYCFYKYGDEIKSMIWLSFTINVLAALPPFYIMSVYNFSLSAESIPTLLWLSIGVIIVGILEVFYKRMRGNILATSGKELSVFISYQVLSKLLWLPYAMTSNAGVSSQLARLKDIDQIRSIATSSSTMSYFDLPFIVVFLVAIVAIAGTVALFVLLGVFAMLCFCLYARFQYQKVTTQSSRANAMVNYQWNDLLANLPSIQGLPILQVIQSRFRSAMNQSLDDGEVVSRTNTSIQKIGQAFIQIIGASSIVVAVFMTLEGHSDAGAMIAIIILVWKVLTPIMGIYNAIIKFQTFSNSTKQINSLMTMNDNRQLIEKSAPINTISGDVMLKDVTQRYQGALSGLTQLNFKITAQQKVAIAGPSGCGKTTLLNIIGGIWEQYQGAVFADGYNIRQFNNFCYRNAIRYVPIDLHFFEGSLRDNFYFYNGTMTNAQMLDLAQHYKLTPWLGEGLETVIDHEFLINIPNGVRELLRLCVGLGNCEQDFILIDEPLLGCASDFQQVFTSCFSGRFKHKTLIYTTNEKNLIAAADNCLLLDQNGGQKYYGFPDKVLAVL